MSTHNIISEVTGSVWKIEAAVGQRVSLGQSIVIVESMKMEIPVEAPADGVITVIRVEEGQPVAEGQTVAVIDTAA
ncbi:MAG: acetyl-CoA carboxylase biotin carboxyl carrier protein subunit [Burkholderiaceae bacterium]